VKSIIGGRFSPGGRKAKETSIGFRGVGPDSNPAWLQEGRIRILGGKESHPMRGNMEAVAKEIKL
jgi:hypothetical protein